MTVTEQNGKPFGWAFVGAGGIADSVAKRVIGEKHRLICVYNRTESKAKKLADKYGAKVCASVEEAAAFTGVDAVYVNTTPNVHFALAKRALSFGKPVLLEKPFTVNSNEARELSALAREKKVYLSEAMWTWFSPQPYAIKTAIDGGKIGEVLRAEINFCLPIAFSKNNRLLKKELCGGALLDLGVYPITYAYRLFGLPHNIKANATMKRGVDVKDDVTLCYDGFEVAIKTSVQSLRGVGESLKIVGSKGKITSCAYHSGGGFRISGGGGMRGEKNAMRVQFDRVAEEIRQGKTESDFVPIADTLAVMELLDAVREKIDLVF